MILADQDVQTSSSLNMLILGESVNTENYYLRRSIQGQLPGAGSSETGKVGRECDLPLFDQSNKLYSDS